MVLETIDGDSMKKAYIETYGCQMNFSDSEIVTSILQSNGYGSTDIVKDADIILINTCSIRDNAEKKVRKRLAQFQLLKKDNPRLVLGILGCMASRLKSQLLEEEQLVDIVVGPDSYRVLPRLINHAMNGQDAVNVILSLEETYADICPVRKNNQISAFISITRGCDNMCSFCIVPFTRGRERSRDPKTILKEATNLFKEGYREVTLLGQNVDSYLWFGGGAKKNMNKFPRITNRLNFAELLHMVAEINPELRVRFSTSHPKDITDEVLRVMTKNSNICKHIHLPVQSGNDDILRKMNRDYSRNWYLERVASIRSLIPDCAISTDIIAGFCGETEAQHSDTISLMEKVNFNFAYMFKYSDRPGTTANRKFSDNISDDVKTRRLNEIIELQQKHSLLWHRAALNRTHKILVEGISKRSENCFFGRNSQNSVFVFPKDGTKIGDYINIKTKTCTSATLVGEIVQEKTLADGYNATTN